MLNAVRYDRVIDFLERYRSVDVLLVDDIQFLSGKEGTQTEFFHTFNALYDSQNQIEHSRARRIVDSTHCLRIADGTGDFIAARARGVEGYPRARRKRGKD